MTKKAWCEANRINEQTYYRWQKLVWESEIKNTVLKPIEANEINFAEYRPPIGEIILEIQNGADHETIGTTLRALKSLC